MQVPFYEEKSVKLVRVAFFRSDFVQIHRLTEISFRTDKNQQQI
jgi:hypothetical protein